MDILLSVSKSDAKCKLFDKNLLECVVASLASKHKICLYAPRVDLGNFNNLEVVDASSEMEAVEAFSKYRNEFIFINRLALCNVNFENLIKYHLNHGKLITVVSKNFVKDKTIPIYKLNEKKEIISSTRKRFADCGIYLLNQRIDFKEHKNIYSIVSQAIEDNEIKGFVHKGYWWTSSNVRRRSDGKKFNVK